MPIGNEAYNRLYTKMKSVNIILAWGHARVIENLLGEKARMNPAPVRAMSDQFAASKTVLEKALMAAGREIEFVQRHRAEEDLAVAAASILARDEFVKGLAKLEKEFGMRLPKGASAAVDAAAKDFVAKFGAEKRAGFPSCIFGRPCAPRDCRNRRKWNGRNGNGRTGPASRNNYW